MGSKLQQDIKTREEANRQETMKEEQRGDQEVHFTIINPLNSFFCPFSGFYWIGTVKSDRKVEEEEKGKTRSKLLAIVQVVACSYK